MPEDDKSSWDVTFWGALLISLIMAIQTFALLMSRKKLGDQRATALKLAEEFRQAREKAKLEQNAAEREAAAREVARISTEIMEQQKRIEEIEKERTAAREKVEKVVSWEELFAKETK